MRIRGIRTGPQQLFGQSPTVRVVIVRIPERVRGLEAHHFGALFVTGGVNCHST